MEIKIKRISFSKLMIYFVLFFISIVSIFPIINLLAISLTERKFIASLNGLEIFPKGLNFLVYKSLLASNQVQRGFLNAFYITFTGTIINVLGTSITAYVLSRKRFKARIIFIILIVITMVVEPGIVPDYLVIKHLGLLNSYWAPILYKSINPYFLIVMIRYFEDIPESLIEAAMLDGANHLQIFSRIVFLISKPAIASITLFYAVFHWNEYFRSMVYLTSPKKYPLQVVLREFVVDSDSAALGSKSLMHASQIDIQALKAGIIILTIIPVLLFYPIILKNFTKGTMKGLEK